MLLAFETVARSGSACLADDAGAISRRRDLAGGEAERGLVAMLSELIDEAGRISALAVAVGPGSFTGLRVAVLAARTLAWLEDVPVHPVDTLAALALERGDGLWWTLLPLKRDTTFAGLFRVADGRCEVLAASAPFPDSAPPAPHPLAGEAVAIGPALATKPGLAERWCPGVRLGSPAGPSALGVARAARQVPPLAGNRVVPAYHLASAPELQRARGG